MYLLSAHFFTLCNTCKIVSPTINNFFGFCSLKFFHRLVTNLFFKAKMNQTLNLRYLFCQVWINKNYECLKYWTICFDSIALWRDSVWPNKYRKEFRHPHIIIWIKNKTCTIWTCMILKQNKIRASFVDKSTLVLNSKTMQFFFLYLFWNWLITLYFCGNVQS